MTTEAVNDRKANDTQVGGQHYKSEFQHWDFVHVMGLDYYEGCATKYVTRRKGNRIEDLRKAKHFLLKKKELTPLLQGRHVNEVAVQEFCLANKLTVREQMFLLAVVARSYGLAIEHLDKLLEEERF